MYDNTEADDTDADESNACELVTDGGREVTDSAEDAGDDTGGFVFDHSDENGDKTDSESDGTDDGGDDGTGYTATIERVPEHEPNPDADPETQCESCGAMYHAYRAEMQREIGMLLLCNGCKKKRNELRDANTNANHTKEQDAEDTDDHSDESESDEGDSDETDEGSGDDGQSVADQFDRLTEGMRVSVDLYETDLVVSDEAEVGGRRYVYFEFANGRSGTTKAMQKYDSGQVRMQTGLFNDKGEVTEIIVRPEGYDGEDSEDSENTDEQESATVSESWRGAFISTSWGYDSTTVNAAQITDVSDSGKTVVARLVATERVEAHRTYEDVRPTAEQFGDEFRLHVRSGGGDKPVFRGSYPFIQGDSDNGTRMGTFLPWNNDPEATTYQSAPNTR
jgi:hypothetical protein